MSDPLADLDAELQAILANASPQQLRKAGSGIVRTMKTANAKRIRANVTPEGAPMAPRKASSLRPQRLGERVRAARAKTPPRMFRKAASKLQGKVGPDGAELFFRGTADRVMAVHHFGLRDRVSRKPKAPTVAYPERSVLGLSIDDRDRISTMIIAMITA
ncbi:MAG: phage virion morphogenesis protein [Alphaproteobacteria bacterium]|nr:MAG: phage virion morphogenesis protein [Alphaproteobacteria bacterium]